jgi:uncharacterized protein
MATFLPHIIFNQTFIISSFRTIFWEQQKALIISDLHLGKSGHFRKAGIAIPQTVLQEDLFRLLAQIQFYKPTQLIIVGDLFHSHANKEHNLFLKWRNDIPNIEMQLVMGNHDILHNDFYKKANIILHKNILEIDDFIFAHDINDIKQEDGKYYFSGHIHPSIQMQGMGRQSVKLPCFYFSKNYAVLPAFGKFTGTYPIKKQKEDIVFALVENNIIKL